MSDTAEVVDAEVVPEHPEPEPARSTSVALAPRERRSEVIRPLDTAQLVESFKAYQDLLPQLLAGSDYQAAGKDKDGNPKRFVKKSGWRKIATAFDLDVVRVTETIDRDDNGQPIRAMAVYRAIAPSGRSMDGDGYCSVDEDRFSGPRGNKAKLENDLRATATTRAKNRAISDLVGMGDVSAEEVTDGGDHTSPPFGEAWPADQNPRAGAAINYLLAPDVPWTADPPPVQEVVNAIFKDAGGYFPAVVAKALLHVEAALRARLDTEPKDDT